MYLKQANMNIADINTATLKDHSMFFFLSSAAAMMPL